MELISGVALCGVISAGSPLGCRCCYVARTDTIEGPALLAVRVFCTAVAPTIVHVVQTIVPASYFTSKCIPQNACLSGFFFHVCVSFDVRYCFFFFSCACVCVCMRVCACV